MSDTANEEVQDEVSMEDTIRATLANIREREPEAVEEITTAPEAVDDPTENKHERTRDAAGKFAAKEDEAPSEIKQDQPTDLNEPIVTPELQKIGMRKDEAAEWSKTPPKIQEFVQRRINETMQGLEQYKGAAQFGQNIYKEIQPYEALIRSENSTPEAAIRSLLNTAYVLRHGTAQQKTQAVNQMINYYGVDLSTSQQEQQYIDPNIQSLQQQFNQMQGFIQNQQAQTQQQQEQALYSEITQAAQGKEHFEAVRPEMAALLQSGRAKDLNEAYEMAIWARPDIRSSLLAQQQDEARKNAAKVAQEAKAAASVNVPRKGKLPASAPIGSMEDTIRAKYRELTGS